MLPLTGEFPQTITRAHMRMPWNKYAYDPARVQHMLMLSNSHRRTREEIWLCIIPTANLLLLVPRMLIGEPCSENRKLISSS